MATCKGKNIETVDCVQWDGLKETALAFFGMDVLEAEDTFGCNHFFDGRNLWSRSNNELDDLMVPIGWFIVKENGTTIDMCPEQFNDQYEIIDEYPA